MRMDGRVAERRRNRTGRVFEREEEGRDIRTAGRGDKAGKGMAGREGRGILLSREEVDRAGREGRGRAGPEVAEKQKAPTSLKESDLVLFDLETIV